jgi:hypothetical protein
MKTVFAFLVICFCAFAAYVYQTSQAPASSPAAAQIPNTATSWPTQAVEVSIARGITFLGKSITLEQLRPHIEGLLITMDTLPNQIPIQFEHEVMMGNRSEIMTQAEAALDAVKASRVKPLLDAIISPLSTELQTNVLLKVADCKVEADFAFVIASPTLPDGQTLDYRKTPYKEAFIKGQYAPGVFVLLKREGDYWKTIKMVHGSLEVPFVCWWKEFGAPKSLFPSSMLSDNCKS